MKRIRREVATLDHNTLVIREPLGQRSLHDVPLPEPLELRGNPVALLLDERRSDR